jgi:hypothetical protein
MVINVLKMAKEAKVKVPDLITRPVGRIMFNKAMDKLFNISEEEILLLDFEGIKVTDSSFIDEFIVKLILDSGSRNYYVKLTNISDISEINIDSVFNSYSNYNDKRIAVCRSELGKNNRYYIGPLNEQESDIIDFFRINRSAEPEEISRFTGLELSSVQGIMSELNRLRLVRKTGTGFTSL